MAHLWLKMWGEMLDVLGLMPVILLGSTKDTCGDQLEASLMLRKPDLQSSRNRPLSTTLHPSYNFPEPDFFMHKFIFDSEYQAMSGSNINLSKILCKKNCPSVKE